MSAPVTHSVAEQIERHADKSVVDPFRLIDEASPARVRGTQPAAAFLNLIEQALGENTDPDATFFTDSWTAGVAVASENFLRRRARTRPEPETLSWDTFSSFTPFFVAPTEASAEPARSLRKVHAEENSAELLGGRGVNEERYQEHAEDEAEIPHPLTLESACRALGVSAMSTREQIRAAYREMASRYHPDRLSPGGARQQKLASDRMASINEAYRLLCAGLVGQWSACWSR